MTDASVGPAGVHTIAVGVDGSPAGQRALDWAAARSRETGAEIVAIHVLTYDQEFARDVPPIGMTNWRRELERDLTGPWTERARAAGAKLRTIIVEDESTTAGLLAAARRERADLIVLGVHGHGNIADRLLGATTYKIAHRARTPVVIVPAGWTPGDTA